MGLVVDAAHVSGHADVALQEIQRETRVLLHAGGALGQAGGRLRGDEHLDHAQHQHEADHQRDHQLNQRQAGHRGTTVHDHAHSSVSRAKVVALSGSSGSQRWSPQLTATLTLPPL
ncbi:hypothetical protein G6F50_016256 [Rhizopus delemar]|uniref:Uncharacterized protein n=1 Tax=Rhizopus delemar TaxID=936053 RepID=A0A9P7C217_9FUNG|nr:hypothetical protein G6F50_016256 [Rhizopus delemar]